MLPPRSDGVGLQVARMTELSFPLGDCVRTSGLLAYPSPAQDASDRHDRSARTQPLVASDVVH
jgi:hypothetical protein